MLDDRGKYIYLTNEELEAIVAYLEKKGRLSKSELTKECNRLIRLSPLNEVLSPFRMNNAFKRKKPNGPQRLKLKCKLYKKTDYV